MICVILTVCGVCQLIFFFSSRRRHTRCSRDWSSDVCSSDLRDPAAIGLECRINYAAGPAEWTRQAAEWRRIGGTHLSVNTMRANLASPRAHLDAIRRAWEVLAGAS